MKSQNEMHSRRNVLRSAAAGFGSFALATGSSAKVKSDKALIAITLDLEMSRNFPTRETMHWDFEKGNLDEQAKRYSVDAAKLVSSHGGKLHYFLVGRVLEQADVSWLKEIVKLGHPIGNHTYDHVNVIAKNASDLQFRFQRAPWLLRGMSVPEAIRDNIELTSIAMKSRLGIDANGFRTPGGFNGGLKQEPEVRKMLKQLGYQWISSLYPAHPYTKPVEKPSEKIINEIVAAMHQSQPFQYEDGLIEIPMSPISDIGAFRTGQWQLEWFIETIEMCLAWAIENRAVFDFLAHPSCLGVVDPEMKTIRRICEIVNQNAGKADMVGLDTISARFQKG
ncbi:MAG: polysaccharide deacetylase family protein [bacterium]